MSFCQALRHTLEENRSQFLNVPHNPPILNSEVDIPISTPQKLCSFQKEILRLGVVAHICNHNYA
jgi:hypothetical protein